EEIPLIDAVNSGRYRGVAGRYALQEREPRRDGRDTGRFGYIFSTGESNNLYERLTTHLRNIERYRGDPQNVVVTISRMPTAQGGPGSPGERKRAWYQPQQQMRLRAQGRPTRDVIRVPRRNELEIG